MKTLSQGCRADFWAFVTRKAIRSLLFLVLTVAVNGLTLAAGAGNPQVTESLRVTNLQGFPVSGATVLVGPQSGVPFTGNQVITDAQGRIPHLPEWTQPLPVSIEAPGYVRTTYLNTLPSQRDFIVNEVDGEAQIELQGTTTEFGRLRKDGKVDFGLVIPAMTRSRVLRFDVSSVLSPLTDTIRVAGKEIEIPSNLTLPKQRESYFIPITLNKPSYRLYFRDPGLHHISASHGQFPLSQVVNDIRGGKSIYEVVNHFKFKQGGELSVELNGPQQGQDIAVNKRAFSQTHTVQAPHYGPNQVMMSLALRDHNGYLYPSDLKRVSSGESSDLQLSNDPEGTGHVIVSLLSPDNAPRYNEDQDQDQNQGPDQDDLHPFYLLAKSLRALNHPTFEEYLETTNINPAEGQMSFSIRSTDKPGPTQFLPFVNPPEIHDQAIVLSLPNSSSDIRPFATVLTLSEIETIQSGKITTEKRTFLWEIKSDQWIDQVQLPQLPFQRQPNRTYRWEVLYLGTSDSSKSTRQIQGLYDIDSVTHITRNSFNF